MDQKYQGGILLKESRKQKSGLVSSVKKAFSGSSQNSDSGSRGSSESDSSPNNLRKKCRRSKNNFTNSSKYYIDSSN
jgi:hypothetical protein